jgi:multicomponent Na+:H+ antiporter subunit E
VSGSRAGRWLRGHLPVLVWLVLVWVLLWGSWSWADALAASWSRCW